MTDKWTTEKCFECDGYGVVSDYGLGYDFYGPKECNCLNGMIWISPQGRIADYPGGPFRGSIRIKS